MRHLGPTAQDFRAAFGLGERPEPRGARHGRVALAAIQALYRMSRALEARPRALEATIQELGDLRRRLETLEAQGLERPAREAAPPGRDPAGSR